MCRVKQVKRRPLWVAFLLAVKFGDFIKRGEKCIFLLKNLHMSKKSRTFAPEIGIDMFTTCSGETERATQGCDL